MSANKDMQKISYAKSRSHTLAKLTGTFHEEQEAEKAAKNAPTTTAPGSSLPAPPGGLPPPPGLPQKPNGGIPKPPGLEVAKGGAENAPSPLKRRRDESDEEEGGDAAMEEDSDGGEMDMSDSD